MLSLINVKKDYLLKDQEPVHALKGITLHFRSREFVAILGHSGCGKTTLLNITGGLDHYDDGDLIIKNVSTKDFKDADWDTYRNHSIGFVFQSYNLIPHQTILKNVELALTISGIKKEERISRAKDALDIVGLKGLYYKKPNQLSGGQMQRVAIARALVNNPEIVLADEPTGALDSETSIQVMDILREVSKTHLVIMVTHNPELAEQYATRIVRMKDGLITSDSRPFDGKDGLKQYRCPKCKTVYEGELEKCPNCGIPIIYQKDEEKSKGRKKYSSMSFFTAFGLSVSNLFSKFKRTLLVAIAGSIGIIGVSTILGVSCGVNDYIYNMEDDMLSSYPLEISEETVDMASLLNGLSSQDKSEIANFDTSTKVGMDSMISYLMSKYTDFTNVKTNDITSDLVDYLKEMPENYTSAIDLDYSIDPTNNFFTAFKKEKNGEKQIISFNGLTQQYIKTLMTVKGFEEYAQFVDLFTSFMRQLPAEEDYILSQYDLLGESRFPTADNELVLVVDRDTTLTDLTLAQMGYYSQEDFLNIAKKAVKNRDAQKEYINGDISKEEYDAKLKENDENYTYDSSFSYEEILNHEFYYYPHQALFTTNEQDMVFHNQVTLSLSGIYLPGMLNYNFIVGLNYDSAEDAMLGTLIVLNSSNEIVLNQSILLRRDRDYQVTKEHRSVADGRWAISLGGVGLEIVIDSDNYTVNPTNPKQSTFTATGVLKTTLNGFPITVNLTSGSIIEIEPNTPDYWYNATIDQSSEMYLNPNSANGEAIKVVGILRAKSTTNFGSLSRGVYYTKQFTEKYMKDSIASDITESFKKHILEMHYDVSPFNAYVFFDYDDYNADDGSITFTPTTKKGYSSALNGDRSSTISSIFASFLSGGSDNLKSDKLHLRAISGLKVNDIVDDNFTSTIIGHEILEVPQTISLYPKDFRQKDNVVSYLNKWNQNIDITLKSGKVLTANDRSELTYSDTISMIITVISTLVTTISAALIAFTSLSLVVSCFMIAVITYISIMERVKEIGVIRSLGGRKKDVTRLFTAENLITGFSSGAIGILVTYGLQVIINLVVHIFGVPAICALPWYYALMMVGISVLLSVLSGAIPSQSASKQDPVIALRTE